MICDLAVHGNTLTKGKSQATLANRMPVDALRIPFKSSRHPEGPMFREINVIWEIPVEIGNPTSVIDR